MIDRAGHVFDDRRRQLDEFSARRFQREAMFVIATRRILPKLIFRIQIVNRGLQNDAHRRRCRSKNGLPTYGGGAIRQSDVARQGKLRSGSR